MTEFTGMTSQSPRILLTAVVSQHRRDPTLDRPQLMRDQETIEKLFTEEFGYQLDPRMRLNPTWDDFRNKLRDFAEERSPDDYVAVYLAGHGEIRDVGEGGSEHLFFPSDVDPEKLGRTAIRSGDLAETLLDETRIRRLLLIVDACHSGLGGLDFSRAVLARARWGNRDQTPDSGVVVLTSTHPKERAMAGAFASAFDRAARARAAAGHAPDYVEIDAIDAVLRDDPAAPLSQRTSCQILFSAAAPRFFPNRRHANNLVHLSVDEADSLWSAHREQKLLRDRELTGQFLPRIRGFVGRHRALRDLAKWLRDPVDTRAHVITGAPGSGKSALLGLLAAWNDVDQRPLVEFDSVEIAGLLAEPGRIRLSMYAGGLSTVSVLAGIAAGAELAPVDPDPARFVSERARVLRELSLRGEIMTVMIDALDEAQDPDSLTEDLIGPLLARSNSPIRLLLGTRPHVTRRFPEHWGRRHVQIDLDGAAYADPESLAQVVRRTLLAPAILRPSVTWSTITSLPVDEGESSTNIDLENPYSAAAPEVLEGVVEALSNVAGLSFFVAKILAASQLHEPIPPNPAHPSWRRSLPRKAGPAMERDLRLKLGGDVTRAIELLRPLAYARGTGLPWENIWPQLATTLGSRRYVNADLEHLRRVAGSYIVESSSLEQRSAYRLYHRSLTEYLLGGRDQDEDQRAIAMTLEQLVPRRAGGRPDWQRAHPYIRAYLPLHAALLPVVSDESGNS